MISLQRTEIKKVHEFAHSENVVNRLVSYVKNPGRILISNIDKTTAQFVYVRIAVSQCFFLFENANAELLSRAH